MGKTPIYYKKGPPIIKLGVAGTFKIGEAKPVDSKLAEQILKKKRIKFYKSDGGAAETAETAETGGR